MKKTIACVCAFVLTMGWMLLIFGFSSQSGTESGSLSALLSEPITKLLIRFADDSSTEAESALFSRVDIGVRKIAHFTEYAILGGLLVLLFRIRRVRMIWLPWLIGTLYAVTDEWHQSFSPGRSCDPKDVLIDACGVLIGVLISFTLMQRWRKKHACHS
ncbi:MAG: VanZ family protein [Aristaeellaceae bacterium]